MADIKGTNIIAPVVPCTTEDIYPTHIDTYGKGGWRSVENFSDLDNIPNDRRSEGMAVRVISEQKTYLYKKSGDTYIWEPQQYITGDYTEKHVPVFDASGNIVDSSTFQYAILPKTIKIGGTELKEQDFIELLSLIEKSKNSDK